MSEKDPGEKRFETEEDLSKAEIPELLPVLPLRGIVIFPSQVHPFLVSRAASLKLIEEVGGTSRDNRPGLAKESRRGESGARRTLSARHGGADSQDAQVPGSERAGAGAGTGADRAGRISSSSEPYFQAKVTRACGNCSWRIKETRRAPGPSGKPIFEIRFAGAVSAGRVAGHGDAGAGAGPPDRPGRVISENRGRGTAGSSVDAGCAAAARKADRHPEPRDRAARTRATRSNRRSRPS